MRQQQLFYADHSGNGQIYAQIWFPEQQPFRGVVQIVHGLNEYGARYHELAAFLNAQGWIVAAADHFGHGQSVQAGSALGTLAPRDGWLHMLEDVRSLQQHLRESYPDLPFVLMGHSMGSFLVRDLLSRYSEPATAVILSGTGTYPSFLCSVGILLLDLCALFKGRHGHSSFIRKKMMAFYNRPFRQEGPLAWLSRDAAVCQAHEEDPLCSYLPDINFYAELLRGIRHMERTEKMSEPARDTPILLVSGREDPVGGHGRGVSRAYRRFYERGCPVEMLLYPGGRHEMLHETNKEEVYQDILDWLNDCLSASAEKQQKENQA